MSNGYIIQGYEGSDKECITNKKYVGAQRTRYGQW